MKSKKIIILLLIIISLINGIFIIHGYRDGIIKSPFKPVNVTQNNINVATIIVYCFQILNVILLVFALKKNKYKNLIIVIVILIITCFIPVKYEHYYEVGCSHMLNGHEPHCIDKYKNIYSITLKVDEYTK